MRPISPEAISVRPQESVAVRNRQDVDSVPTARISLHRGAHRGFGELPRIVERELLAESLLENPVRDRRTAARGHEVLRRDRPAHIARVHVGAFAVHPGDDELHVERIVALHRRIHDVRDQLRALFHGQRIAATQREEPTFSFREVHEVFRVRHCPGDRHRGRAVEGENLLDHLGSDEEPLRGALVRREDDAVLASYSDRCGHVEPRMSMSPVEYVDWNGGSLVTSARLFLCGKPFEALKSVVAYLPGKKFKESELIADTSLGPRGFPENLEEDRILWVIACRLTRPLSRVRATSSKNEGENSPIACCQHLWVQMLPVW